MAAKHFWLYQDEITTIVSGRDDDFLADLPTGSGKTLIMIAIAILLLSGKRILIATTQQHIEDAFTKRDYDTIVRTDGSTLSVPPESVRAARTMKGSVRAVRNHLSAADNPGYIMACTHKTLTCIRPPTGIPEDCSNLVLMVDEGHHGAAAGIGQFVEAVSRAGGRIIYFTATPSRDDNDPVLRTNMVLFRRPLAQHMEEGFAPKTMQTKIHAIKASDVTEGQFFGEETPALATQKLIITYMIQAWEADGKPKTIVRVPPVRGGTDSLIDHIVNAFTQAGARVLDVSGQTPADKKRFLTELPKEREVKDYNDSQYDVLVGIQRTNEGLDWPLCSTVYCVGLPRSVLLIAQLLGRATRLKLQLNYPELHKDHFRIEFFAPCGSEETRDGMLDYHRRYTLLIVAYLASVRAGAEWALVRDVGRGLVLPLGVATPGQAVQTALQNWPYVDDVLRAEATAKLAAAVTDLKASGSTAPDYQVMDWVWDHYPDTNRTVVRIVAAEIIAQATGEAKERVLKRLISNIKQSLKQSLPVREAFRNAFNSVLEDMDSYALIQSQILSDVSEMLISLTGQQMRVIAARLGQARPLTPEWLGRVVLEHHKQTGSWPRATTSGSPPGWPEESWVEINQAIAARQRSWPLQTFFGLNDFVNVYIRRGTIGQLLSKYCMEVQLDFAERAFINHLARQRVLVRGQSVVFGDLPVPSVLQIEWPKNYWWVVKWWFEDIKNSLEVHPLADLYAAVVVENLHRWLINKEQQAEPPFVTDETKQALQQEWRNTWVRYCTPEPGYKAETPLAILDAGQHGRAMVWRTPLSATNCLTLQRRDGVVMFSPRLSVGYFDAAIHARFLLSEFGSPRDSAPENMTSVTPFSLPLSWIVAVTTPDGDLSSVPLDWVRALRQLPVKAYSRSGVAETV